MYPQEHTVEHLVPSWLCCGAFGRTLAGSNQSWEQQALKVIAEPDPNLELSASWSTMTDWTPKTVVREGN